MTKLSLDIVDELLVICDIIVAGFIFLKDAAY
jgi:hypothetical protein